MQRLQKLLAAAGAGSRRGAETLITAGRVTVNGTVVTTLGTQVDPERDQVAVDGVPVSLGRRQTLLLNKPAGYVTTREDVHAPLTVMSLVPEIPGLHPVGRLDKDTTGLLLLTNDGALTFALTHPKHRIPKTYHAWVRGVPTEEAQAQIRHGGIPVEGKPAAPAPTRIRARREDRALLEIVLHEGRKREVRQLLGAIGHPVITLRRVQLGPLDLGDLPEGQWRELSEAEVRGLYRAAGVEPGVGS
ncbi:MAG: pseudouridine synthase [Armatimonadota bacterium]